jgi:hypothetical protein
MWALTTFRILIKYGYKSNKKAPFYETFKKMNACILSNWHKQNQCRIVSECFSVNQNWIVLAAFRIMKSNFESAWLENFFRRFGQSFGQTLGAGTKSAQRIKGIDSGIVPIAKMKVERVISYRGYSDAFKR